MPRLHIDSRFRTSGSVSNYLYTMGKPVKNVLSMSLVGVNVPRTIYPVISGYNNVVQWSNADVDSGNVQSITITPQNYTGAQLAAVLSAAIQAAFVATTISVTYSKQTNKFAINTTESVSSFPLVFEAMTNAAYLIGTEPGEELSISLNEERSEELPCQVNLSFPQYLYLRLQFNGRSTRSVITNDNEHTFVVPYGNSSFLDYHEFNKFTHFEQRAMNPGIDFEEIDVEWSIPGLQSTDFDFGCIDHQITIELNPGSD